MKDTVLIIAPSDDMHAQSVASLINKQFNSHAIIWDNSRISSVDRLNFSLSNSTNNPKVKSTEGHIYLNSIHSIWWRRPSKFNIDDCIKQPNIREFCFREYNTLFRGVFDSIDVPIINNPEAESVAAHKPLQLKTAKKAGLTIPKTIMSNDPDEIESFWRDVDKRCIYKTFNSPSWRMAETRILSEDDVKDLEKVRYAPIIVQEKIDKGLDVRVNIFGDQVFAACVNTHISAAELDWRLDLTANWTQYILPDEISKKLVNLLRILGLNYGCIDLRQKPDGEYVFFEVNPSGQFLFVQIDTGQPLIQSICKLLLNPNAYQRKNIAENYI